MGIRKRLADYAVLFKSYHEKLPQISITLEPDILSISANSTHVPDQVLLLGNHGTLA